MMKTGIGSQYYLSHGSVDYKDVKKYGFDCVDYRGIGDIKQDVFHIAEEDFCSRMLEEKGRADRAGVEIHQIHAPWPVDDSTEEKRIQNMEYMKRAVLGTSLLGASYFVVHPLMPFDWENDEDPDFTIRCNREFFKTLAEYARPLGVTICIENMPFKKYGLSYIKNLVPFVKDMNMDNLKICLDTGHANVSDKEVGDMVRLCGDELKALHVHDNNGMWDEHAIPYTRAIDWNDFRKALKEIDYHGCITLETTGPMKGCPEDIREEMLFMLSKIAKSLT